MHRVPWLWEALRSAFWPFCDPIFVLFFLVNLPFVEIYVTPLAWEIVKSNYFWVQTNIELLTTSCITFTSICYEFEGQNQHKQIWQFFSQSIIRFRKLIVNICQSMNFSFTPQQSILGVRISYSTFYEIRIVTCKAHFVSLRHWIHISCHHLNWQSKFSRWNLLKSAYLKLNLIVEWTKCNSYKNIFKMTCTATKISL